MLLLQREVRSLLHDDCRRPPRGKYLKSFDSNRHNCKLSDLHCFSSRKEAVPVKIRQERDEILTSHWIEAVSPLSPGVKSMILILTIDPRHLAVYLRRYVQQADQGVDQYGCGRVHWKGGIGHYHAFRSYGHLHWPDGPRRRCLLHQVWQGRQVLLYCGKYSFRSGEDLAKLERYMADKISLKSLWRTIVTQKDTTNASGKALFMWLLSCSITYVTKKVVTVHKLITCQIFLYFL